MPTDTIGFGKPEYCEIEFRKRKNIRSHGDPAKFNLFNLKRTPLLAPGEEGIKGVELANAIFLSFWLNRSVEHQLMLIFISRNYRKR